MSWTTTAELLAQLDRQWARGDLLREVMAGAPSGRFPLRLSLRGPSSTEITDRFDKVREWAASLSANPKVRLEWQDVRHRVQGQQRLPVAAWVDTLDDAASLLGRRKELARFSALVERTRREAPVLLPWLERRPLQALDLLEQWTRLLAVVHWVRAQPRPGIYLRQVDIPGVHTKFIESHRAVLTEWLDLAMAPEHVDASKTGVAQFAARYGFLDKTPRIRLRSLDPEILALAGTTCPDLTLDVDSFCRLAVKAERVLITENEVNYLALPGAARTVAIFGAGYGWDAIAGAGWLASCEIRYWGDIDTHGFAILDQLRAHFAHARSLLMDRTTLEAHQSVWGREDRPQRADLLRLTADELDLYNDLRDNRIRENLRLEQEHLGFEWVRERL